MSLLTNLSAYYKYDESSGTAPADATGNGHTGTFVGTSGSQWVAGALNNGVNLNGTNNGVTAANASDLQFTGDFAISLWVNPNATQSAFHDLVRKENNTDINTGYGIEQDGSANHLSYTAGFKGGGAAPGWGVLAFTLTSATFTHIVFVHSGTSLIIYKNGSSTSSTTDAHTTVGTDTSLLQMGKWTGNSAFFKGILDEVGLWNRALSSAEVTQLYNSGTPLAFSNFGGAPTGGTLLTLGV